MILEDRLPCRAVAFFTGQAVYRCRDHRIDDSLIIILGHPPGVIEQTWTAILIDSIRIVDPHNFSFLALHALCDSHGFIRADRGVRGQDDFLVKETILDQEESTETTDTKSTKEEHRVISQWPFRSEEGDGGNSQHRQVSDESRSERHRCSHARVT